MKRKIEQYEKCIPCELCKSSEATIYYMLNDMRDDILELHNALNHIIKYDSDGLGEIGYQLALRALKNS